MKKIALASAVVTTMFFGSCQTKESLKKDFIKDCYKAGDLKLDDPKMLQAFHEYCQCSGEKVVEKMTVKEMNDMNNQKNHGDDPEIQAKLMPIIQPCLLELQRKMSDLMDAGAPAMPSATIDTLSGDSTAADD